MKKIAVISLILFLAFFLRFYKLDTVPPGLYIDEASIGYNAYSILKTGKDQYGERLPLWFRSFGDYKPPVYVYLTSVSMVIFGKNELAVRFPSALAGTLTVVVVYFLVKGLFGGKFTSEVFPPAKGGGPNPASAGLLTSEVLAFLTALLLAISPWHLQFSRAGFEANLALFFFILASFIALKFWQGKKVLFLFLSFFFYGLTFYTYHVYRIITPLWLVFVGTIFLKSLPELRKAIVLAIVFLILFSLPFIQYSFFPQGLARFNLTSAFAYEKPQNYPAIFLRNYLSYFSLPFLFANGDGIGRHQIDGFGPLSYWQLPFLFGGLWLMIKKRKEAIVKTIILFLLLTPVAAALARPSPHTLRSLPMVIPLLLIITTGIIYWWYKTNRAGKLLVLFIFIIGFYEFLSYLHGYYVHYPKNHQMDWGGAYKQMVERTKIYLPKYSSVFVNDALGGHTNIYFLFYGLKIPKEFVPSNGQKPKELTKKVLYISPDISSQKPANAHLLENIYLSNPNQDIFAQFWEL